MTTFFGGATALVSGTLTLTTQSGQQFFYIQNNDTNPLTAVFKDGSGTTLGQVVLDPAPVSGQEGGYRDSVSFPMFQDSATVVLNGTTSGPFSSGASKTVPTQVFHQDPTASRGR